MNDRDNETRRPHAEHIAEPCRFQLQHIGIRASLCLKYDYTKFILHLLVSTYVVCERLSVMHRPARLPENFDQNSGEHPCSGIWFQNTPPSPQK